MNKLNIEINERNKKTENLNKKTSGIGNICPICANKNRADLYPE